MSNHETSCSPMAYGELHFAETDVGRGVRDAMEDRRIGLKAPRQFFEANEYTTAYMMAWLRAEIDEIEEQARSP